MTTRSLTRKLLLPIAAALSCLAAVPAGAAAQTGGASYVGQTPAMTPAPVSTPVPGKRARLLANGRAVAPAAAPARVKRVIAAANRIIGKPYRYGGGHSAFTARLDSGYDCSGTVSYALRGGRFLRSPLPSGPLMSWGRPGPGRWITVYAHGGHAYAVIAGLRLDTGYRDRTAPTRSGPAWSKRMRPSTGYTVRHPARF